MASVGGVSGSNMTSSLYNSANVISGLASGLDTEGMIEGLVQSYQQKIQSLSNKITKTEWKQEAYRSIIAKATAFASKYTSYTSSTNLLSTSFFNNAVNVASMGANKAAVTASGRTESDVKITSVKQLATSARYTTASSLKGANNNFAVKADDAIDFTDRFVTSALSGTMTFAYGGQNVSISFDQYNDIIPERKTVTNTDGTTSEVLLTDQEKAQELYKMIESKLADTQVTLSSGEAKNANELIKVDFSGGKISFSDKTKGGNTVYIASASDSIEEALGLDLKEANEKKPAVIDSSKVTKYINSTTIARHVNGKKMSITLDGKTKTFALPRISGEMLVDDQGRILKDENGQNMKVTGDNYAKVLQQTIDKEFGPGKIKVTNEAVDSVGAHDAENMKLSIKAPDNSDMVVNTEAGKALGIGNSATNYLNTVKTLGEMMDDSAWEDLEPAKAVGYDVKIRDGKRYDMAGNLINEKGNLIDAKGNELYAFKVNGVTIGNYGKDTKLSTVLNDLNNNSEAGVRGSYSQTTRQFTFSTKDTGVENGIEFGSGLAQTIFGNTQYVDLDELSSESAKDILGTTASLKDRNLIMFVGDKTINYGIKGTNPSVKNVMDVINNELKDKGLTASISDLDGSLIVADKDGNRQDVTFGTSDTLARDFFAGIAAKKSDYLKNTDSYTNGQDAIFSAEINGQPMVLTRGSNTTSIDGMTVNFKDTFNTDYVQRNAADTEYEIPEDAKLETEAVTFQRTTDSDKIVENVRNMVNDYNEMMSEVRNQYSTLPYRKTSNGAFSDYDPLTDEDKATMSESAIQAYEQKAKQGLLFNDNNLKGLYDKMLGIFTTGTADQLALQQMGLSITYSSVDGSAQLGLDENKLRSALDNDPDAVANAFTRVGGNGQNPGIMQSMKATLDQYASLTGSTKGILVQQAGTPLNSLSLINNTWQTQMDSISNEIEKWQDKLSAQVDKYTSIFSKLETLIYQMNSQSSTLAGLMGG